MALHIIAPKHELAIGTGDLDLGRLVLVGHGLRAVGVVDDVVAAEVLCFGEAFSAYFAGSFSFVVVLVLAVVMTRLSVRSWHWGGWDG